MDLEQSLTKRELEISEMLVQGLSRERIAKNLFLAEGTVKNYITAIYEKTGVRNRVQLAAAYIAYQQAKTDLSIPQNIKYPDSRAERVCSRLRLVGLHGLPDVIPLPLPSPLQRPLSHSGRPFVIGRFDVSVGKKQCDFEFGKDTKAVSRRHASIEQTASGIAIVDLDSRAGTFINGCRIMPGEPCAIHDGDHVSFGNLGADYVFEDAGD